MQTLIRANVSFCNSVSKIIFFYFSLFLMNSGFREKCIYMNFIQSYHLKRIYFTSFANKFIKNCFINYSNEWIFFNKN